MESAANPHAPDAGGLRRSARLGGALFLFVVLSGCSVLRPREAPLHAEAPAGAWYTVKEGETAADIAARAGVPLEDLLEINGLEKNQALAPGQVIFVLEGEKRADAPPPAAATGGARFRWPLAEPRLTSPFGRRNGRPHEGIDLGAPTGTAIFAADAGFVVYAGTAVRGYGNMVVLRHSDDLVTVYAHNSLVLVRTGDRVRGGQEIARVGQSGRATAPHLHFEVRVKEQPQDPMRFLPPLTGTGALAER